MNQPPPAGGFGAPQQYPVGAYPPAPPPPQPKKMSGCLLAVILLVVIGVPALGVFSVLAIYGVRKYIAGAKTAEARNTVGHVAKLAADAYARNGKLCPSAASPVPSDINAVRGKKYQSSAADWQGDDKRSGWACLGFELTVPQYYQYAYTVAGSTFIVTAHGDLNGDGEVSTFEVTGTVEGDHVVIEPTIRDVNPEE